MTRKLYTRRYQLSLTGDDLAAINKEAVETGKRPNVVMADLIHAQLQEREHDASSDALRSAVEQNTLLLSALYNEQVWANSRFAGLLLRSFEQLGVRAETLGGQGGRNGTTSGMALAYMGGTRLGKQTDFWQAVAEKLADGYQLQEAIRYGCTSLGLPTEPFFGMKQGGSATGHAQAPSPARPQQGQGAVKPGNRKPKRNKGKQQNDGAANGGAKGAGDGRA